MNRLISTLFMTIATDDKISMGASKELSFDNDLSIIDTVKENLCQNHEIERIAKLYGVKSDKMNHYPSHEGGRNLVFRNGDMVIRISKNTDRTIEDYLAEAEYVHYLSLGGADTVDVIPSVNGKMVEKVENKYITSFTLAKGDQIADHGYRYLDGVSLSEYFYIIGKTLGKIHALSKIYKPTHRRFDFFEKYNEAYFNELIPGEYIELKNVLSGLLRQLRSIPRTNDNYGMVHFDFSDGNYNIDYKSGKLTVFDFENCRTCFYLFDLANLWAHGVGWIAYEPDENKRRVFMNKYFDSILDGYRSETEFAKNELSLLPLMIQTVLMENIIDEFEVQKAETGGFKLDGEQAYRIKCMIEGIHYMGFFDEVYSAEHPFELNIEK